ncbi:MAG: DinB family protein [Bacteroidota bacterium]
MPVNLDAYATPQNAPATQAARREALLAQLGWLTVEAEALGPLMANLPPGVLTGRPMPGTRSVKETFGLLAALDRTVHAPQIARMLSEDAPALDRADEAALADDAWNEAPLDALLGSMRDARQALLDRLAAVPLESWQRTATLASAGDADGVAPRTDEAETMTLSTYVLRICQHDADRLRDLAYRLHESKLTTRKDDLPK